MSATATAMLRLESILMPLSSPEATDRQPTAVMTTMMRSCTQLTIGVPHRVCMPALICSTPRPTDTAMPKVVPTMARTSMSLPGAE